MQPHNYNISKHQGEHIKRRMAKIIGILNITPDSFSDGGKNFDANQAIAEFHKMLEEGADIIDIGAESTRPGAKLLSAEAEWQRLKPLLERLKNSVYLQKLSHLSIDSRHYQTFQHISQMLPNTALMINDVSANYGSQMLECAKRAIIRHKNTRLVVMHNLGIPADRDITLPINSTEEEIINQVMNFALKKIGFLENQGIARGNIIFDIGIGFGKTGQQSLVLLKNLAKFKELGAEILLGHSRKSFLNIFTKQPAKSRDFETAIISGLMAQYCDYLRVHNISDNLQAIKIANSITIMQ